MDKRDIVAVVGDWAGGGRFFCMGGYADSKRGFLG